MYVSSISGSLFANAVVPLYYELAVPSLPTHSAPLHTAHCTLHTAHCRWRRLFPLPRDSLLGHSH